MDRFDVINFNDLTGPGGGDWVKIGGGSFGVVFSVSMLCFWTTLQFKKLENVESQVENNTTQAQELSGGENLSSGSSVSKIHVLEIQQIMLRCQYFNSGESKGDLTDRGSIIILRGMLLPSICFASLLALLPLLFFRNTCHVVIRVWCSISDQLSSNPYPSYLSTALPLSYSSTFPQLFSHSLRESI